MKRRRHAVEHLLLRVFAAAVRVLPERVALGLGWSLGWIGGVVVRVRRADVDRHLGWAFPEASRRWRRRVARLSYAHLGREAVTTLRMSWMGRDALVARTRIQGFDAFRSAIAEGKGVVLVTAHHGSWELGGAAFAARGLPVLAVIKRMANRRVDAFWGEARGRLGVAVVDIGDAPREAVRALRSGWIVGMLADQNARRDGVFVPFFGRAAATFRGPALFALRTGAPIFVGVCFREPGAVPRYRLEVERLEVERRGSLDQDVARLTQRYTALLEQAVRRAPEQYFWQHRRWKTRPPDDTS